MHDLRRRFGIEGDDEDVTGIDVPDGRIYVGLPPRESRLLGDLVRQSEIGCVLSLDPVAPAVIGVYAMRPITRA
jgi:hypothetical protein